MFWYNAHARAMKKVGSLDIEKWKKYKLKYIIDYNWIMYLGFMVL
jgi:hypothetical protein